jgi:ATP-dependent Clp protease ATP-binding subunit ClpC
MATGGIINNMAHDFHEFSMRLTDNARDSLQASERIARNLGSAYVGTEHLLLGVLSQDSSVAAKILSEAGITLDRAQMALNLTPRTLIVGTGIRGLSETAKLTLKMSMDIATEFHQDYCGTEHILYGLLTQKNARATVLLRDMNAPLEELTAEVEDYLGHQQSSDEQTATKKKHKTAASKGALGVYGTDITDLARHGKLDTVIGRDQQIERIITILSRRTKNNPVLVGEPGVGKTAIVEGLAQRIVAERVPEHLLDKHIIQLDLASMIAGTKYRGEFEERLKKVMAEITANKNIIVFIDELHLLVGAGSAEGSMDAANILKPALARGQFRLIGATTTDEYRKYIEKDSALERRLQMITVPEPTLHETVSIMKGLKHHYETHHGVMIDDDIIEVAVNLADRYVTERFMPDKAIDVLDEAASRVRVAHNKCAPEVRALKKEISVLTDKMDDAVTNEEYQKAALVKTRISQLNDKIQKIEKKLPKKKKKLTEEDMSHAISLMTGIPVSKVMAKEAAKLHSLEKHLAKSVVGQQEALDRVARAVRRARSGISSTSRPTGSFIFMGPTGVGKTELARVLAREVFGSDKALIKIDMSELGDKHTASRLVGAPAGYVGYDDSNQLTDRVRRQPYSVILFDEIEKAHPDVLQLLLQILEDGTLTDGKGRVVNFTHSIIILTSNLGAEAMQKEATLGFRASSLQDRENLNDVHEHNKTAAKDALKRIMRPELINRFDDIIVFRALTRREVSKIFDILIGDLQKRLMQKGLRLIVDPSLKRDIIKKGYDEQYGARPLRRVIQDTIEHAIAEGILRNTYDKGTVLRARLDKHKVVIEEAKEE